MIAENGGFGAPCIYVSYLSSGETYANALSR